MTSSALRSPALRGSRVQRPAAEPATPLERAELSLQNHPAFRGRFGWVRCVAKGDGVLLTGSVPSYYLKQLAQELLRQSLGEQPVENQIVVSCPGDH